jgi:DegV family protein with EDD domain
MIYNLCMNIKVMSDSSCGLKYAQFTHNVDVINTSICFGDLILIDSVDITADEFYKLLLTEKRIPTTTAPILGEIVRAIENAKAAGYTDVIFIPISYKLSAYGTNLKNLLESQIKDINIHVYDCRLATLVQGVLAMFCEYLTTKQLSISEIFAELDKFRKEIKAYFVVDDIKYLVKNGRLSAIKGGIANLLKLKPIIQLTQDGVLENIENCRTFKTSIEHTKTMLLSNLKADDVPLFIILHTTRYDDALKYQQEFINLNLSPYIPILSTISPTIGAHIGSGVLGCGYFKVTSPHALHFFNSLGPNK